MSVAVLRPLLISALCIGFASCCNIVYDEVTCSETLDGLPNFMTYSNKTYYLYNYKMVNWYQANIICKEHKMDLLSISNEDEFNVVRDFFTRLQPTDIFMWTSGTDLAKEGDWRWMTNGQKVAVKNFHNNQPDNYKNQEHCLHMSKSKGQWKFNDILCSNEYYFICEMKRMCLIHF